MADLPTIEGTIPFDVPQAGKSCSTYYKIVGNLESGKTPLIAIHGGPGIPHENLLGLTNLTKNYSIPIIFYDQIGNGQSTHLPEKNGDTSFWTDKLFLEELDNLIDVLGIRERGFDILGQSWGGMLGSRYAAQNPRGLGKLILADTPASIELWDKSAEMLKLRFPKSVQEVLDRCEKEGTMDSQEYMDALMMFYQKHLCNVKPWPAPELIPSLTWLATDSTVNNTMQGLTKMSVTGSLKGWTIIDDIHKIKASTLLINGSDDGAQDISVEPFFKHLPKVKWVTIQNASHFPHIEQKEQFMKLAGDFLES